MKTISELIYEYLKKDKDRWWYGGHLERYVTQLHKPGTINRELRRMAKEKRVYQDKELVDSRWVRIYKFKKI